MVSYKNDELVPASEFPKKFGFYLSQITSKKVEKLAILKNNRIEAIFLSKEEYENLKSAYDDIQKIK
ncbi:hypothetical protein [Sulfurovum sp.]|uniref:hypothetical protein n=1 Tax=Sulfurovum sp. TaxID=1969726 RepID=UPI0028681449|nr:hypothetical protein [Sulfurovum sp.]